MTSIRVHRSPRVHRCIARAFGVAERVEMVGHDGRPHVAVLLANGTLLALQTGSSSRPHAPLGRARRLR